MKLFLNKYKYLLLTFLISFVIFYPSLFVFFTNDDFFFLKISRAENFNQFLNFFNFIKSSSGFGMYRPLTTQVFYFISTNIFNLQPLPLHIISFIFFFGIVYLVYKLILELSNNGKIALIAAFLYAVSATHFGHLYYLATFQELGMTFFVLLCCLSFLKGRKLLSLVFFILALMSKETAVVTPFLLSLIYFYRSKGRFNWVEFKKFVIFLLPFLICLFAYFLLRFTAYGFATGDSYIWDFSVKKLINTLFWYLLWSLNIPESLIDFIGPGLTVNPNLFLYWSKQITPILILFFIQGILLAWVLVKALLEKTKEEIKSRDSVSIFCIGWFLISLIPVAFLPLHKFTFYLTLPLIGLVFRISYLLVTSKVNNFFIGLFIIVWMVTSVLTLKFTYETNWISQSEIVAGKVSEYFASNKQGVSSENIYFIDTSKDLLLPWSPTATVMTILSNKNFFKVLYPELSAKVNYVGVNKVQTTTKDQIIESRQFLGY